MFTTKLKIGAALMLGVCLSVYAVGMALLRTAEGNLQTKTVKRSPAGPTEVDVRNRPMPRADHWPEEYWSLYQEWEKSRVAEKPTFAARFLDFARKHPDDNAALEALGMVERGGGQVHNEPVVKILHTILDKNPTRGGQGRACFWLGQLAKMQSDLAVLLADAKDLDKIRDYSQRWGKEQVENLMAAGPEKLLREAEYYFERVLAQFADVPNVDGTSLGDAAERSLFEIRQLCIGRVAPEIAGEDIDGKPLKLSEFRGKVVVLVFCGHWCGPCRAVYPAQRDLVKELAKQPFVLLGINSDESRDKIKELGKKGEITWRAWWDGGSTSGPISESWNVSAWPTVYVLDSDGVIRYRGYNNGSATAIVRSLLKKQQ